jgi:putative polyketide hydroxylase
VENLRESVRRVAGRDLEIATVKNGTHFGNATRLAERYRVGRVFLAGDAAHHMPPTGGFGLNTGVQDVHNLAWKLAAVLHGWAGPGLLDSYEAERLPYGRAITEQALANARSLGRGETLDATPPGALARPEFLNELGMIFGAQYESNAIVPDGTPPPKVANPVTDYEPSARPGSRAPHVWIERDAARLSTVDLFDGRRFTLLAGPEGGAWCNAARAAAERLGAPLDALTISAAASLADGEGRWLATYGLERDGVVLVRPDGYVAWRKASAPADPFVEVSGALERVLSRPPRAPR